MQGIHCKLSLNENGQFRRFLFSGKSFVELRDQVKKLLVLNNDQFQLCYLDNEGDMIIISSDEELACAISFTKDVLRLFVNPPRKGCSQTTAVTPETVPHSPHHGHVIPHCQVPPHHPVNGGEPHAHVHPHHFHGAPHSDFHHVHGAHHHEDDMDKESAPCGRSTQWHANHHHMRGSGRGGCKRGGGRRGGHHHGPHHGGAGGGNWREFKKDKISVKIACLQSLLDQEGDLSEHSKSKLEKKLNKLQQKLQRIESFKDNEVGCTTGMTTTTTDSPASTSGPCTGVSAPGCTAAEVPYCKRDKNQTRELWIKIKAKKAELRAAEREGRDEAIKDLVSQLNALKLEKAAFYH